MIQARGHQYSSVLWNALEYLALFGIVLMHEFGHSLACRQVGGRADQIVLWPLGGVAYVAPPPRPGATLWSIAAGPLVNVLLTPVLFGLWFLAVKAGWSDTMPNLAIFLETVLRINTGLLVFNLLPVYPLDGGQILQSLLWFIVGRARSLMIASVIGMAGVAVLIALALWSWSLLLGVVAVFILMNCWQGLRHARMLARIARLPRQSGFRCPLCKQPPILGDISRCRQCARPFNPFQSQGVCPQCGGMQPVVDCFECGRQSALERWGVPPPIPSASRMPVPEGNRDEP